ncbi:hypothetical protein IJ579_06075 [bacterium]|nr:hypothetical protein [bacterium]
MEEKTLDKKYEDFIDGLLTQVNDLVPKDINKLQSSYLINNMRKSARVLALSMQEEKVFSKLDFLTHCTYIQVMLEWSFHKEIDLFRSGIPAKHWKPIMQKIWATMWDVMFACVENQATDDVLLNVIEKYVTKTYENAIDELKAKNEITPETGEKAKEQSNIKIMAQELKIAVSAYKWIKKLIIMLAIGISTGLAVAFIVFKLQLLGIVIVLSLAIAINVLMITNKWIQ